MNTFMAEFEKQLRAAVEANPERYAYSGQDITELLPNIRRAIATQTFSKEGTSFKATCKALGIKHTYKAIQHFIDNHA